MFGPNLAVCQLATWAADAIKFKIKLIKEWKRKPKTNDVVVDWEIKCGKCLPIFHDFAVFLQLFSKL